MKLEQWGDEHRAIVRKLKACRDMPEDEFSIFWAKCVQHELDPLLDQALPVKRNQKEKGRGGQETWVTVYSFQSTEAGMLARAERFPDYLGVQACAVFSEEPCPMSVATGEVHHEFNPTKRLGALSGAWGRVLRKGRTPVLIWLSFDGTKQDSTFWTKNPLVMMEKCARVAAIRKAYPETFGGVYVLEEMPSDEAPRSPISGTRKVDAPAVAPATSGPAPEVEDALRAEAEAICAAAETLGPGTTPEAQAAYAELHKRAVALPKGSAARLQVSKAMVAASARMKQPAPPASDAALNEAEMMADAICGDAEGMEPGDADGFRALQARAEKMPEGAARARAQAALDAIRSKHQPKKGSAA